MVIILDNLVRFFGQYRLGRVQNFIMGHVFKYPNLDLEILRCRLKHDITENVRISKMLQDSLKWSPRGLTVYSFQTFVS